MIKPSTIRALLSFAVQFNWSIRQLDVSNSFLHGSLTEIVFMEQPKGFLDKQHPDFVFKLHKAHYGLKHRAWFHRLSSFLLELGFTTSLVDTSLFTFFSGLTPVYMLVYVDDIIITGPNNALICVVIT
jgi:hypothetical protein